MSTAHGFPPVRPFALTSHSVTLPQSTDLGDSFATLEAPAEHRPERSLACAVGRGFSWLTMSVILGKVFGAIAQLLLGRWITDEQYGDLAIVVSVAAIVKVLQDGGVPQVLIQRGEAEFSHSWAPHFG